MKCVFCKCDGNLDYGKTNDLVDFKGRIIIIKNVPCMVCPQCGEEYYDNDTMKRVEELFDKAKATLYDYAEIDYEDNLDVVYKLIKVPAREEFVTKAAETTCYYGSDN